MIQVGSKVRSFDFARGDRGRGARLGRLGLCRDLGGGVAADRLGGADVGALLHGRLASDDGHCGEAEAAGRQCAADGRGRARLADSNPPRLHRHHAAAGLRSRAHSRRGRGGELSSA